MTQEDKDIQREQAPESAPQTQETQVETQPEAEEPQKEEDVDKRSLKSVLKAEAHEDEPPLSSTFTLRRVLGGDILSTDFVRRQIWLLLLITAFMVVYIANRYSVQQDLIEIDNLTEQLKDAKYKALASGSDVTERCRESNVLEQLKNKKDSVLKIPNQPPYIINVPDE